MRTKNYRRVHGGHTPLWVKYNLEDKPPVDCEFPIGDKVIFTNEYGVKFNMEVIGYSKNTDFYGRFIHTIREGTDGSGSAWWFPCRPDELKKIIHKEGK